MSKIIAIEGIDGTGKHTQARKLVDQLIGHGIDAVLMGFPCYSETLHGKEIGRYLNGEFGGLDEVHPKLAALLYAGDRAEKKTLILDSLAQGKVLVIDRYVASNMAHQGAKLAGVVREEMLDWLAKLEYGVHGLPQAHLTLLLDMDISQSQRLVLNKNVRDYTDKKQDLHEADQQYMRNVAAVYRQLAVAPQWYQVDCMKNGELRQIDDISAELLAEALKLLAKN